MLSNSAPMNRLSRHWTAILVSGLWINASEFFRNEVLLKSHWTSHYLSLGLTFPSGPVNGMVWMLWGFLFATGTMHLSRATTLLKAVLIAWLFGFVLMWLVLWNLNVLPVDILPYAIPLSLLETWGAVYVCQRLVPRHSPI
jgi:hypothetical protein